MSGKCKIYWGYGPSVSLFGIGWGWNLLFDVGWLHEERFPLPVICIGNLTVGGTGKTPHTEYLIRLLQNSFRLAVLSRGYKRKSKGFVLASSTSRMEDIGDEPYQMARKFPAIHVAVDGDRCRGIRQLISPQGAPDTEVILLDDAFQHRYVRPGTAHPADGLPSPCGMWPASSCRTPSGTSQWKENGPICSSSRNVRLPSAWRNANVSDNVYILLPHQEVFFTTLAYGKLYPYLWMLLPNRWMC